jgi:hypothetical protein
MTLATQLVGKRAKQALSGSYTDANIIGAVEITTATNTAKALTTLERQIKGSQGDILVIAIKA